jgi:hypothetical protein
MPNKGDIYLGELGSETLLSAFGRTLKISDMEISREERTSSGRLVRDVTATKKKFELSYDMIDGDVLTAVLALYDLQDELSLLIYYENTTTTGEGSSCDAYTVLMKPIDRTRILLLENGLWGSVNIVLEET